jgi:hypothetical protein
MAVSTTSPSDATPAEVRAYISDMLSQLADLARAAGDRRLEASMRLLAVQADLRAGRRARASRA